MQNVTGRHNTKLERFFEAFSLSGAIIAMFFIMIVIGVSMDARGIKSGEKVWETFTTALTTFVTGKRIGRDEQNAEKTITTTVTKEP